MDKITGETEYMIFLNIYLTSMEGIMYCFMLLCMYNTTLYFSYKNMLYNLDQIQDFKVY